MSTLTNVEGRLSIAPTIDEERYQQSQIRRIDEVGWGASRAEIKADEKGIMAKYFCRHDFLVSENQSPESGRETVASILVIQGTSPNRVVEEALRWVLDQDRQEFPRKPFFLTWYTPGHLVPTTLKTYRDEHHLRTATKLFLFPGEVDEEMQAVSGAEAEIFAEQLQRRFTYAFLSAYSFDVSTGNVYFHLPRELRLQKACATRFASHKYLFLDSSKFKSEGEKGYTIRDLLETADRVTVYTVSSSPERDSWIKTKFKQLCASLLKDHLDLEEENRSDVKTLRLQIVGRDDSGTTGIEEKGVLLTN